METVHTLQVGRHTLHSPQNDIHTVHSLQVGFHNAHSLQDGAHTVHCTQEHQAGEEEVVEEENALKVLHSATGIQTRAKSFLSRSRRKERFVKKNFKAD